MKLHYLALMRDKNSFAPTNDKACQMFINHIEFNVMRSSCHNSYC